MNRSVSGCTGRTWDVSASVSYTHLDVYKRQLEGLIRFGRGVDTSKLREAGFEYRYSSAGTIRSFAQANNLRRATGGSGEEYRYEQDVEQFFRHSPTVVRGVDT